VPGEVHDVVLAERRQERDAADAPAAEQADVDAGHPVEDGADLLGLDGGLGQALGRVGHHQNAQALAVLARRARRGDGMAGDHLPADAELGREERLAVVAQLPRHLDQPFVEPQVQVGRGGIAQPAPCRLGQEVREDEAAEALEVAHRGRAPRSGGGDVLHLGRQVAQEGVVDPRLAARDERADLGQVDDVHVALTQDGELDGRAGLVRHRCLSARHSRSVGPTESRQGERRSRRNAVAMPGTDTSYTPGSSRGMRSVPCASVRAE
jgi:hypothetical protein